MGLRASGKVGLGRAEGTQRGPCCVPGPAAHAHLCPGLLLLPLGYECLPSLVLGPAGSSWARGTVPEGWRRRWTGATDRAPQWEPGNSRAIQKGRTSKTGRVPRLRTPRQEYLTGGQGWCLSAPFHSQRSSPRSLQSPPDPTATLGLGEVGPCVSQHEEVTPTVGAVTPGWEPSSPPAISPQNPAALGAGPEPQRTRS